MTYYNVLTHGREKKAMKVKTLHKDEPALLLGALTSAIVAAAAHWNIVIDQASLGAVLAPILSAALIRWRVNPK